MSTPILKLEGVCKSFGGARALVDGALELYPGQISALLGENGAGKSTLVKILTGVHQPDGGRIVVDGREVRIESPQAAARLGISVIHQESVLFDHLSVAENIFVADLPASLPPVRWRQMRQRAASLLAQIGSPIDPRTSVGDLSVAQKHLVQIARALSHDARIVIMDEATAALSQHEADDLLRIVRGMREQGRAVLYISHKFQEVLRIADRYIVFRDGACVGSGLAAQTSVDELARLMVGRQGTSQPARTYAPVGAQLLRVESLGRRHEFSDVSFSVHAGEIVGVYGLIGAGRSELLRTLFGLARADAGRMLVAGRETRFRHPDAAIRAGIAYVPEDRQAQGAILTRSIASNIVLPSLARFSRRGLLDRAREFSAASRWVRRLQIKCNGADQRVGELSGGNQQKVVLAKWLLAAPRVLLLDEPTKGIDVGAKAAVHRLIEESAARGMAVLMVSSELPEVMAVADRLLVMRRGRLCASFDRGAAGAPDILRAASGN